MNLFVGSLSHKIDDESLRKIFETYGKVSSAKVIINKNTGISKGFGFVEMPNDDEAKASMKKLNRECVKGSFIRVKEALPRKNKFSSY